MFFRGVWRLRISELRIEGESGSSLCGQKWWCRLNIFIGAHWLVDSRVRGIKTLYAHSKWSLVSGGGVIVPETEKQIILELI